ncbi:uracil phosphoribosyltransferase [Stomatohabitans albus]|uniref:uracil phosphoribosyltransferase n=1 Tax=Stomatohabitans albus TaxID=3110766 RepID=UPI00300D10A9
MQNSRLHVSTHPLSGHFLTDLRSTSTTPERYRVLTHRLTSVLALEATAGMDVRDVPVTTPLQETTGHYLAQPIVAVPILRAGLGMLDAITELFPAVSVGYIGLERNEETLQPTEYYFKAPALDGAHVLMIDPMLATGGSAAVAAKLLRNQGAATLSLICVIAAPEGVDKLLSADDGIEIYTASLDDGLNERGYILPGLGDYGDRLFGTELIGTGLVS